MMPDLGKHAATVLAAYGVSLLLIAALVALSLLRSRRVRRALDDQIARSRRDHG